jgi:hypothetical protein
MELDLQSLFGFLCTAVLIAETPQLPPHLGSYTRALLVSQDRRHIFVTTCASYTRLVPDPQHFSDDGNSCTAESSSCTSLSYHSRKKRYLLYRFSVSPTLFLTSQNRQKRPLSTVPICCFSGLCLVRLLSPSL